MANMEEELVYRLRKRAEIRRQIKTRKSVQQNEPDRIADLLEEAANRIEELEKPVVIAQSDRVTVAQGIDRIVPIDEVESSILPRTTKFNT